MKKNILFCIGTLNGGGAERVVVNLANYLFTNSNWCVSIATLTGGVYTESLNKGIIVHKLADKNRLKPLKDIFIIRKIIYRTKPDIVVATLPADIIKLFLANYLSYPRAKIISRQACIYSIGSLNIIFSYILKMAYKHSTVIVANSPDTRRNIQEFFSIYNKEIKVIPNPVFENNIINFSNRKKDDIEVQNYILSIGSLRPVKGFDILLKAFKIVLRKNSDMNLLILGQGPMYQELVDLAENLDIKKNVHFCGFKINLYPYYKSAKVFVLSSRSEGFGNVLVEALAFGCPIVSTNCQGGPNYILEGGKYGLLVPVNNPEAMAEAMDQLITRKIKFESAEQMGRAKDFSIESVSQNYIKLFDEIWTTYISPIEY